MEIDFKKKYHALRLKFVESMNMSFRLGFEQGQKEAQMEQALQAASDAQAAAANAQNQVDENGNPINDEVDENGNPIEDQPGQEAQPGQESEEGQPPMAGAPNGSELDQHISKLEGLVSGSNASEPAAQEEIKKSLASIKSWQMKKSQYEELAKSQKAISGIKKALKGPAKHDYKVGMVASHNLDSNQKKALSMQEKMVSDIMKSWSDEESQVSKSISNILSVEGLKKD